MATATLISIPVACVFAVVQHLATTGLRLRRPGRPADGRRADGGRGTVRPSRL
jgi:hypothetical protein